MQVAKELRSIAEFFNREAHSSTTQLEDIEVELSRYARPIVKTVLLSASSHPVFHKAKSFAKAFNVNPDDEAHALFLFRQGILPKVREHWEAAPKGLGRFAGDKVVDAKRPKRKGGSLVAVRAVETMPEADQLQLRRRQMKDWARCCEWLADQAEQAPVKPRTSKERVKARIRELRAVNTRWKSIVKILDREYPRPGEPWTQSAARTLIYERKKIARK